LPPDKLASALEHLESLPLDRSAKNALRDILKAASNKGHSAPDVIVKSLPLERQKLINKTAREMKAITDDVMARGKQRLMDMSDDEWDRLVNNG